MGAGYAQVGLLLLLTVVGLPLFFFGLMAALDRFERAISPRPGAAATPPPEPAATGQVTTVQAEPTTAPAKPATETAPAGAVVSLPIAPAPAAAPLAAGGAAAVAAGK